MNTKTDADAAVKPSQNSAPIFFKLIDTDQDKTERTVKDLTDVSEKLGIAELLQLRSIMHTPGDGYVSVFSLNLETGMKPDIAEKALSFMEYVFKNLFHKHPAYTEPEL